jgi:hypothetical protein
MFADGIARSFTSCTGLTKATAAFFKADEDEDKKQDDVLSNSSTIPLTDELTSSTAPKSATTIPLDMHGAPLAQMDAREQEEGLAVAAAMENSVRNLALNNSASRHGHLGAPPSIHMRIAMNRNDGAVPPFGQTKDSPPNTLDVERVQC